MLPFVLLLKKAMDVIDVTTDGGPQYRCLPEASRPRKWAKPTGPLFQTFNLTSSPTRADHGYIFRR
jgi:hypothetical protein